MNSSVSNIANNLSPFLRAFLTSDLVYFGFNSTAHLPLYCNGLAFSWNNGANRRESVAVANVSRSVNGSISNITDNGTSLELTLLARQYQPRFFARY